MGIYGFNLSARAITVSALQKDLTGPKTVTVIDIRDTMVFVQGHIPTAINIPASLCPQKKLPPLGHVVIYDDGLGRRGKTALNAAAAALAAKPGITVDILAGGYAAWESGKGLTTSARGLHHETFDYITYPQLAAAAPGDVLLVDLRKPTKAVMKMSGALTDLATEFPGRRLAKAVPDQKDASSGPLMVLIDSVDGSAEAQARILKARGIHRYAILAGGELAIARKGRRGLGRMSAQINYTPRQQTPPPTEPAQ